MMKYIRKLKANRIEKKQCNPCWWYDKELELCELHIDYIEKNCKLRSIEFKKVSEK